MTTVANLFTLAAISLIRFGGRGGSGIAFLLFGLLAVGVVGWALTRPGGNYPTPPRNASPRSNLPAAGTQE